MSRSALFSRTILSICFVSVSSASPSDSMDRYFNRPAQKCAPEFTELGPIVVVTGKSGIGKTWAVRNALGPCAEFTCEILKSKQTTMDFIEKLAGTDIPVLLDEYECVQELVGTREITGAPSRGIFIIVTQVPVRFNFEYSLYQFPVPSPEFIKKIIPSASDRAILDCNGDIRNVLMSIQFVSDRSDIFQCPRDFVTSLVCQTSTANPAHYVGHIVQEPGNVSSILHENYTDSGADMARVADHLSWADVFENRVYAGDWDLFPFFNLFGCILPAVEINHSIAGPLRPGSVWTKYQNMCMRSKRIRAMSQRVPGTTLSYDALIVLRDYADTGSDEAVELLAEYAIQPGDLDALNHMSPLRKIKAKTISSLKKCLTRALASPTRKPTNL